MNTEDLDQLEYLIIGNILNNPNLLMSQAVNADYFEDYGCYQIMKRLDELWQAKEPIILLEISEQLGMHLETLINLSHHPADKKTFSLRVEKLRKASIMRGVIRGHVASAVSALDTGTRPEYVAKALIANLTKVLM